MRNSRVRFIRNLVVKQDPIVLATIKREKGERFMLILSTNAINKFVLLS